MSFSQGFLIFALCVLVLIFGFHFLTRRFLNPFKLIMIFGKKGSGKTTFLVRFAIEHLKHGWSVYSTVPIPGCYLIAHEDVGQFMIPPRSLLLIDEVGMIWDNRDFKNFSKAVRNWFKLQRHYKVKVVLASQTFDIDKKLRDLTDEMYLVEKKFRVFSYAKRILKKTVLNKSTSEAPSKLDEDLQFDSFLLFPFGSRRFTFIPKYVPYFDSFDAPALPEREWPKLQPLHLPRSLRPRGTGVATPVLARLRLGLKLYFLDLKDALRSRSDFRKDSCHYSADSKVENSDCEEENR